MQIFSSNFIRNEAINFGGAIYWLYCMPLIFTSKFSDNHAFYGKNEASFPVRLGVQFLSKKLGIIILLNFLNFRSINL